MEKQKAIFKGNEVRKVYRHYVGYAGSEIYSTHDFIKQGVTFYECDLDKPPLEQHEEIYINELDATYIIERRVRSINGEIIYYVSEPIKVIEDEETSKSLEVAKEKQEEYNKTKHKKPSNDCIKPKKKWYQFWK